MSAIRYVVFKAEVNSPLFGTFKAGDVGHNLDPSFVDPLIAAGYVAETTAGDAKKDADAAALKAGRLTKGNADAAEKMRAKNPGKVFASDDLAAQRAAGVVTTGPTDNTVGSEGVAARVAARNARRVDGDMAAATTMDPAVGRSAAAVPTAQPGPVEGTPKAAPTDTGAAPKAPAAAKRAAGPSAKAAPAKDLSGSRRASSGGKAATKASAKK